MSLRVRQSEKRRQQMLDAAETLIRQTGGTDFSMVALARAAEVSPATPYNTFGSKEGLLFALLSRTLQTFLQEALHSPSDDPIEQVLDAADQAVTILLRDPALLRPLYRVLLGLTDPIHHPAYLKETFAFYRASLDGALAKKLLASEAERSALACALMAHFIGVLDLWVHEDIDDRWMRAQVASGYIHLLWPIARGQNLSLLKRRRAETMKVLAKRALQPAFFG